MSKRRQTEADLADSTAASPSAATGGATSGAEKKAKASHPSPEAADASSAAAVAAVVDPTLVAPSPILVCSHDMGPHLRLAKEDSLILHGEKGYRMARATHGIAEGAMYFEIKYLPSTPLRISGKTTVPGVRVGVSTHDGDIQAPVGFDIHSYCYRSATGGKVHNAHVSEYGEAYAVGDVIGVWLVLPPGSGPDSLTSLGGSSTPVTTAAERAAEEARKATGKRAGKKLTGKGAIDRIQQELQAQEAQALSEQTADLDQTAAAMAAAPKLTDAELVQSRKFHKRSFIRFFKNGQPASTSTTASAAATAASPTPVPSPHQLGGESAFVDILRAKYFPAVSLYMGANVQFNFGPDFWCVPDQVRAGVAAALAPPPSASPSAPTVASSQDVTMIDATRIGSSASPSPSPSPPSSSSLLTPPFRHPLPRVLLTSGLFPHLEGSGSVLQLNPKQLAANAAAAEEVRQKALLAAYELARKQGLGPQPVTAATTTATAPTPEAQQQTQAPTTPNNARAAAK